MTQPNQYEDEELDHINGWCSPTKHSPCWFAENITEKDLDYNEEDRLIRAATQAYLAQKLAEEQSVGHWYNGTFGRDANGFEIGHICACGYKSQHKETINQHSQWKLAELKSQGEQGSN